jgi:hypothetical protein
MAPEDHGYRRYGHVDVLGSDLARPDTIQVHRPRSPTKNLAIEGLGLAY